MGVSDSDTGPVYSKMASMAHIQSNTVIFSPSIARAAAATKKDWSFVDGWLAGKFGDVPVFERNPETLRTLLTLAAANEAADEDCDLLARAEAQALGEVQDHGPDLLEESQNPAHDILHALESALPHEGRTALDAMAGAAVELDLVLATPADMARRLIALSAEAHELDRAAARVTILQSHIDSETAHVMDELRLAHYHRSSGDNDDAASGGGQEEEKRQASVLAKQNLESSRRIKAALVQLPLLQDRLAVSSSAAGGRPEPDLAQVRREEVAYLDMLAQKRALDNRVAAFQGLPPDVDLARRELEELRAELRHLTRRRDAVFEGLVERETPRKPRGLR